MNFKLRSVFTTDINGRLFDVSLFAFVELAYYLGEFTVVDSEVFNYYITPVNDHSPFDEAEVYKVALLRAKWVKDE